MAMAGQRPIENVPRAIRSGQPRTDVPPVFPRKASALITNLATQAIPENDIELLQLIAALQQQVVILLSPDNNVQIQKLITSQVNSGQAYDYPIPSWCRHWLLTNRSAGTGAAGNLYYWFNQPSAGAHTLPQNYRTLTAGQSVSENSDFATLTLFADATSTDEGWEISFEGWVA